MGDGFQFIDIILFAMIAAFLIFRLRNVLGRRDGHEGGFHDHLKPDEKKRNADEELDDEDNIVHLTDRGQDDDGSPFEGEEAIASDDPLSAGLKSIKSADPSFVQEEFLDGAAMAFEMILNAYASGDTSVLKNLLSPEVYGNFTQAIRDREQAGEVLEDTLVNIKSTEIVEAYMEAQHATVTVKFISEQVNVTRDESGDVVDGNPNAIITVTDFWTFARDTRSRNPNWTLVATRSLD